MEPPLATVSSTAESSKASRLCLAFGTMRRSPGNAFPAVVLRPETNPTVQDVHGRFAGILVLVESAPRCKRNHGLPQQVFVTAVHGVGTTPARRPPRKFQLLPGQRSQRRLLHAPTVPHRAGSRIVITA